MNNLIQENICVAFLSQSISNKKSISNHFDGKNIDLITYGSELTSPYEILEYKPNIIFADLEFSQNNLYRYIKELKSMTNSKDIPLILIGDIEAINRTPIEIQWLAEEILQLPTPKEDLELVLKSYINIKDKIDSCNLKIDTCLDLLNYPILIVSNKSIIFKNEKFKQDFRLKSDNIFDLFPKKEHQEIKNFISTFLKMNDTGILKANIDVYTNDKKVKEHEISIGRNPNQPNNFILSLNKVEMIRSTTNKIQPLKEEASNELSQREKEVLVHASQGMNSHEIGEKLFISYRTVERHRSNLLRKLNSKNLIQALAIAIKSGKIVI